MMDDQNLVRHLQSCETMGSVTMICSDKTGTLTQNVMTVVEGNLCGDHFTKMGPDNPINQDVLAVIHTSAACNSGANFNQMPDGTQEYNGNATECAILKFSHDLQGGPPTHSSRVNRVDYRPFNSANKMSACIAKMQDGKPILCATGSPEGVVAMCDKAMKNKGGPVA